MLHPDSESDFQEKLERAFDEAEKSEPLCPECDNQLTLVTVFNEIFDTITMKKEFAPKTHYACNHCDRLYL